MDDMAVVSGKFGKIMAGASNLLEVRNWKLNTSGGSRTYTSSSTLGMQRTVDGVHSGTVSFELVLDPAGPIEDQFDIGDLVSMLLYRTASDMYSVTCRITSIDDDVNVEEGEPPTLAVEADTHGQWYGPLSFPTPDIWLDADCTSSLILDGSSVSAWQSKGVSAASLSNTGVNRPTYMASGIGSKPTLVFDSAQAQHLVNSAALFSASTFTLAAVVRFSTGDTGTNFILCQSDASQTDRFSGLGRYSQAGGYLPILTTQNDTPSVRDGRGSTELPFGTAMILVFNVYAAYNGLNKNNLIRYNGVEETVSSAAGAYAPGSINGASRTVVGGELDSTGFVREMHGYIAEVMAWDSSLSTAQMGSVERYLAAKYGISVA